MADVKWIKIVTDVFDDEKVILIESMPEADSIIVIWFKLLCLAGKQNRDGLLMLNDKIAYTDEMLATVFRRPVNVVRLALNTFESFGMIEIVEGTICIANWEKHQNASKLAELREYNRIAQQKSREKRRLLSIVNDSQENVNDSQDTDIEEDKDKDKEIDKEKEVEGEKPKRKRFVPPTLEEVKAYCLERKNNVDPQKFYDYFSASDWHDSKGNKVKSWKQKIITWEGYSNDSKTVGVNGIPINNTSSELDGLF